MSCGVGCRRSSEPALLWLWCRPQLKLQFDPKPGNLHVLQVRPRKKEKNAGLAPQPLGAWWVLCGRQGRDECRKGGVVSMVEPGELGRRRSGGFAAAGAGGRAEACSRDVSRAGPPWQPAEGRQQPRKWLIRP